MRCDSLLTNYEIRKKSRSDLSGKWLHGILMCLLVGMFNGLILLNADAENLNALAVSIVTMIGFAALSPLTYGVSRVFMELAREGRFSFGTLFYPYRKMLRATIFTQVVKIFYLSMWFILLIIPGLIKTFSYSQVSYILNDHPDYTVDEAISLSRHMMDGHKARLLWLMLSFMGWFIVCVITFGIALLWVIPYVQAARANFYLELKKKNESGFGVISAKDEVKHLWDTPEVEDGVGKEVH